MTAIKNRPAVIKETPSSKNGYRYLVVDEKGDYYYLCGPGSPQGDPVGTKGYLTYRSGTCAGIWCWGKD